MKKPKLCLYELNELSNSVFSIKVLATLPAGFLFPSLWKALIVESFKSDDTIVWGLVGCLFY